MDQLVEQYRRWFVYEKDAHAKVVNSLKSMPIDLRETAGFRKALELLAHIATARQLWLYRIGGIKEPPAHLFPRNVSLIDAAQDLERIQVEWDSYLRKLDTQELNRVFEYVSVDGRKRYRNKIEDVLAQLFTHSAYHRGQIAALVRSTGGEPAPTDFVFWSREAV